MRNDHIIAAQGHALKTLHDYYAMHYPAHKAVGLAAASVHAIRGSRSISDASAAIERILAQNPPETLGSLQDSSHQAHVASTPRMSADVGTATAGSTDSLSTSVGTAVSNIGDGVVAGASQAATGVTQGLQTVVSTVAPYVTGAISSIGNTLNSLIGSL